MFNPLYGKSAQRTKHFKALPGSHALNLYGAAAAGRKLYFTDSSKNHIRQVSLRADGTPRQVITFAGSGIGRSGDADKEGVSALFNLPQGLAVSGDTLYVTSGKQIRKLEYREVDY